MRITTQLKISLAILGLLGITSCKPAGTGDANLSDSSNMANLSTCQNGGASLANSEIQGIKNLTSGQSTSLSLESSVNCLESQKAVWTASGVVLGKGSQISAKIKGTGIYVIAVNSVSDVNDLSHVSTKVATDSTVNTSALVGVTNSSVLVVGPQVGVEFNSYDFSLAIPSGTQIISAEWNFNDGSAVVNSLGPVSHSFTIGNHTLAVRAVDANNQVINLNHAISILSLSSGIDCPVQNLVIVGPTQVPAETNTSFSLSETSCLNYAGTLVSWNFGDGTPLATTPTVNHSYNLPGNYTIAVTVRIGSSDSNTVILIRQVTALSFLEEIPGPVPEPTPVPIDLNSCSTLGATRTIQSDIKLRSESCGAEGSQENTYRDQIIQQCQLSGSLQTWVEQSRSEALVSEGTCSHQSCQLSTASGTQRLTDGQSLVLYSSANPAGACTTVQETRTCSNGVISGSASSQYLTCNSGCGEFGPNGTIQMGIVTGQVSIPVTCPFGEEGIVNTLHQISDRTCSNGQIITSNTRNGELKSVGVCPIYTWIGTDVWGSCSADCGGEQTRTFECHDDKGILVGSERCGTAPPIETRICDGNPDAARKLSATTTKEEVGSSAVCPKNQIGVITQERNVTVTVTRACIEHKITEESHETVATPWVTTRYCRDLVTSRCSHDSLSNQKAAGRHEWMVRCQNEVPLIKEFLQNFENATYKNIGLNNTSRHLYPTFLDSKNNKAWIAPTSPNASCEIPATTYIAAVCVSSCATPEQTIIAKSAQDKSLSSVKFIDALTQNMAWVGTLQSNSVMSSKVVQKTAVDKWITELVDTTQPILIFKLKSGGELKVTLNHAILHESGVMKMASEFKVGDNLLQLGAKKDQILAIEQANYFGKVYNLFVKSNDLKKNVVVVNGYLTGTAFYQNEGAQSLNRDLFKNRLLRGVLEK